MQCQGFVNIVPNFVDQVPHESKRFVKEFQEGLRLFMGARSSFTGSKRASRSFEIEVAAYEKAPLLIYRVFTLENESRHPKA